MSSTKRWAWIGALGLVATISAGTPPAAAGSEGDRLVASRTTYLARLAASPKACIKAPSYNNGGSPLFGNCYDWHSDVHAHWALYAVSARTGDATWANAATADLPVSSVNSELSYMRSKIYSNIRDNPYGTAWLLRLVREREQLTGDRALRPLADYAAEALMSKMNSWGSSTWYSYVRNPSYGNVSWAVLNLSEWAAYTGNARLKAWTETIVQTQIKVASQDICDVSRDASTTGSGFFPACLMRLVAVAQVEGAAASAWVAARLPVNFTVPPRPNSGTDHWNALNFTRAFTLEKLAKYTGRDALAENAAMLINWQMDRPTVWAWGNDYTNTHWIAQTGVLAINESY